MIKKKIGTCDSCHTENVYIEEFPDIRPNEKNKILCFVCSNTHIGVIRSQWKANMAKPEVVEISQAIAESTWLILKAIKGQDYKGE